MVPIGILFHAIGGFAAGSFYLPIRKIKGWSWESGWLVNGIFSWLLAPLVVALFVVPDLRGLLSAVPSSTLGWTYFFGVLWGIGGLTFGLSCRYLGLSLGYAVALGFCAFFGTIVPPIYDGTFTALLGKTSGLVLLGGLLVCLVGIAVCGLAGMAKDRDLASTGSPSTKGEYSFIKGVFVALFAGVMSACMSFAFRAGAPIAALATQHGVADLWKNTPVLVVILAGGFTTNALWCVLLNIKNRSAGDYLGKTAGPARRNYLLAAVAGVTWYCQFMFYGMGTTKMGAYDFSSWTLHMSFIIVFSNLWAIRLGEWRETRPRTLRLILTGIVIVFLSTLVVGVSNYLAAPPTNSTSPTN
jgi:L-rhamnose-H+ transport protein